MASTSSTSLPPTTSQDTGLFSLFTRLLGSAQHTLDNGIKTEVTVVFPSSVYFDIFALVVFCTLAIVGINIAARALGSK